ncbi:MAG: antibiotic biosynthesis monooxygenase [Candidatus Eremiobacteraeota bacterium]|nr:antibiotic biosynthesis monooxygenase [Candidatus Eremiobacteraeota bacterium]
MITRVWRGWTTPQNADAYQALLLTKIFPGIAAKAIAGYRGISLVRRAVGAEVEFMTIMWFDSVEDIKAFAGEQYEVAVVPPEPRALLVRFDPHSAHYETIVAPSK